VAALVAAGDEGRVMTKVVEVIWRFEVWFIPKEGKPWRIFQFADEGRWKEEVAKAREGLGSMQSDPGLIEVHDNHTGATVHKEDYP
jgi:hypothetical protein